MLEYRIKTTLEKFKIRTLVVVNNLFVKDKTLVYQTSHYNVRSRFQSFHTIIYKKISFSKAPILLVSRSQKLFIKIRLYSDCNLDIHNTNFVSLILKKIKYLDMGIMLDLLG